MKRNLLGSFARCLVVLLALGVAANGRVHAYEVIIPIELTPSGELALVRNSFQVPGQGGPFLVSGYLGNVPVRSAETGLLTTGERLVGQVLLPNNGAVSYGASLFSIYFFPEFGEEGPPPYPGLFFGNQRELGSGWPGGQWEIRAQPYGDMGPQPQGANRPPFLLVNGRQVDYATTVPYRVDRVPLSIVARDDQLLSLVEVNRLTIGGGAVEEFSSSRFVWLGPPDTSTTIRVRAIDNGSPQLSTTIYVTVKREGGPTTTPDPSADEHDPGEVGPEGNDGGVVDPEDPDPTSTDDPTKTPCMACLCPAGVLENKIDVEVLKDDVDKQSLHLVVSYSSKDPYVGPLGRGRTHRYTAQLMRCRDDSGSFVYVRRPCGKRVEFRELPDGTYGPTSPGENDLEATGNPALPYRLRFRDGRQFLFNSAGFIATALDANGSSDTFCYRADGKLEQVYDEAGDVFHFEYLDNQLARVRNHIGQEVTFTHELGKLGNPLLTGYVRATERSGYRYDDRERMVGLTNSVGLEVCQYQYGEWGTLDTEVVNGHAVTNRVDWTRNEVTTVDPVRGTSVMKFNLDLQPVSIRDPLGAETCYEYDATTKKMVASIDPLGRRTAYTYDSRGNLTSLTDNEGHVWASAYQTINGKECQVSHVDALGNQTVCEYDPRGNLTATVNALGHRTTAEYDARGRPVKFTDARGNSTITTYNEAGAPVAVTDAEGHTETYVYDSAGNKVAETDKRGFTTYRMFDELGRVTRVIFPSTEIGPSPVHQLEYNEAGLLSKTTNALGQETKHRYDQYGRLLEAEDALGNKAGRCYDHAGRLQSMTDLGGHTSRYGYDALDRTVTTVDPLGHAESVTYDVAGRKVSARDKMGFETLYEFNAMDLACAVEIRGGPRFTCEFDALGQPTLALGPSGSRNESHYDAIGRVLRRRSTLPSGEVFETTAEYDENSNALKLTDGMGRVTAHAYDSLNRLHS